VGAQKSKLRFAFFMPNWVRFYPDESREAQVGAGKMKPQSDLVFCCFMILPSPNMVFQL
jgi:hypothetical protein